MEYNTTRAPSPTQHTLTLYWPDFAVSLDEGAKELGVHLPDRGVPGGARCDIMLEGGKTLSFHIHTVEKVRVTWETNDL